jgi:outer membrane protein OmpA-like peptidoglycan-associated protein
LLGVRTLLARGWYGQLAVGEGLGRGYSTPAFEAIASMRYAADLARHAPERPIVRDTDGDGIPDDKDKCPTQPEDKDGFEDQDGCPDLDNDRDGIPDKTDQCPNDAEDKDGFQDDDGCPDPDNDFDGIPDAADKCPNDPEDKDGFQDADGCPDPDNDGDGILDAKDACPNEPETKNGYMDDDGCPDEIPAKVQQFTGEIQRIAFKLGSAELLPTSKKVLDKAVTLMQEFPELKLQIQGHTDDQPIKSGGKFSDNQELSQARAESVRSYLVVMGVSEARLTAKGFGADKPVVDPSGLKGSALSVARTKNRRVEFVLDGF